MLKAKVVRWSVAILTIGGFIGLAPLAYCQTGPPIPGSEFPSIDKVTAGYTKVVSTTDGRPSFYTLWRKDKDGQMLAELPKDFARQRHFIATTVSSGNLYAGLQADDYYVYWRQSAGPHCTQHGRSFHRGS